MNHGEFLTKASVWLALIAYAVTMIVTMRGPATALGRNCARWAWTLGCGFFLVHVVSAFTYFHHWSHAEAYRETAHQTATLVGWQWGGGIYLNYVFAAAWSADVLWWWLAPASFERRPRWLTIIWHAFFFFMFFNGTIVFGHGPVRVLGIVICLVLAAGWWRSHRHERVVR